MSAAATPTNVVVETDVAVASLFTVIKGDVRVARVCPLYLRGLLTLNGVDV